MGRRNTRPATLRKEPMADKKKDEKKAAAPKDDNATIYEEYVHGKTMNDIAEERGLDSKDVMAIIQDIQAKAKKG